MKIRIAFIMLVASLGVAAFAEETVLFDFEDSSQAELVRGKKATVEGGKLHMKLPAYRADMTPGEFFESVVCNLPEGAPKDWADYRTLRVEVTNPMSEEQEIGFRPAVEGTRCLYYKVKPGETRHFDVPLFPFKNKADLTQVEAIVLSVRLHIMRLLHPTEFIVDNVSLVKKSIADDKSVVINLQKPRYRDNIYASLPIKEISAVVECDLPAGESKDYSLQMDFLSDGELMDTKVESSLPERFPLQYDLPRRAETFVIRLTIFDKETGSVVRKVSKTIERLEKKNNEVVLDHHGDLFFSGEKFLPIGVFFTGPLDEMKYVKEAGFNCIGPYHPPSHEFISEAERLGLKMIPHFMGYTPGAFDEAIEEALEIGAYGGLTADSFDGSIERLKDSEALLSYYLYDEPQPKKITREEMIAQAERYAGFDPYHPTSIVNYSDFEYYAGTVDIMMTDSYHLPGSFSGLFRRMEAAVNAMEGIGPVWFVGQMFAYWSYNNRDDRDLESGRPLNYNELRSQMWMSVLLGSKGLFLYNYHTTNPDVIQRITYPKVWKSIGFINTELEALKEVILSNDITELKPTCEKPYFRAQKRKAHGKTYVIVCNGQRETVECRIPLDKMDSNLQELGCAEKPKVEDGFLYLKMAPQTTKIFTNHKRMIRRFDRKIPLAEYRRELANMEPVFEEDSENNVARVDKGATLSASWVFPERGAKNQYGTCRATTWRMMIDGNRASKWRLGDDGRGGAEYVWPDEQIYLGERWLEVTLARKALLEKIIVTITPGADYELKYFEDGSWKTLQQTDSSTTDKYHYQLRASIEEYNVKGIETGRLRLYFNNPDDSENPPTIFEIEAIEKTGAEE